MRAFTCDLCDGTLCFENDTLETASAAMMATGGRVIISPLPLVAEHPFAAILDAWLSRRADGHTFKPFTAPLTTKR